MSSILVTLNLLNFSNKYTTLYTNKFCVQRVITIIISLLFIFQGLSPYEAYSQCPDLYRLDNEIAGGTTAVVAVIVHNRLYVGNVGELTHVMPSSSQTDPPFIQSR